MDNSENVLVLSPDDFQNICRTCLSSSQLESIFSEENGYSIVSMLMAIANVHITVKDNLPPKMCSSCIKTLNLAFRYKQQCEEAEFKLKDLLATYNSIGVNESEIKKDSNIEYDKKIEANCNIDETFPDIIDTKIIVESFETIVYDKETKILTQENNDTFDTNSEVTVKCETKENVKKPTKRIMKECPTCKKLINSKRLKDHIRIMHLMEKYQCEICNQKFTLRSNYIRHLKIHTGEKPHECILCGKAFVQAFVLKEHLRVHTRERPYECKFCEKSFTQSSTLHKHQKVHALENSIDNSERFTCQICDNSFMSSLGLNAHSRTHLLKPFQCNECRKRFDTQKYLDKHHCQQDSTTKKVNVFNCSQCPKIFSSNRSLSGHKYLYHSGMVFLCSFCGKHFQTKAMLNAHSVTHSEERPFPCSECDKTFKTKLTLKIHQLVHTGERPFSCDVCNKTFHQRSHLISHKRMHTGEKPYNCVACGKCFSFKINYTVHMRIHSGEKPYVCPVCNKGFNHSTTMKKHHKTHKKQNKN